MVSFKRKNILTVKDYIYCETCESYVDFWKYDHNIEDAGHEGCKWRYVTDAELKENVRDCFENGCFREQGITGRMLEMSRK